MAGFAPGVAGAYDQAYLFSVFQRVDQDHSGQISANELQSALATGTWAPFNPETVRLMIGMFDADRTGTVGFGEFEQLWNFVTNWSHTFRSFDRDGSGTIDRNELKTALTTFGYRLSDMFYDILLRRFDRSASGTIKFDDFIQLCVVLQTVTAQFRAKDTDRDGMIHVSYEDFLTMVLSVRV